MQCYLTDSNTHRKINEISDDGAYDIRQYCEPVRIKQAVQLISPKKGARFKKRGHLYNLVVSYQKVHGSSQH
ncbi:hypothetical protein [Candidatus Enterovibrio altilux]|uniref:Mobile element protein n=1 Tax=Candidatus Enterovibrio altilux TaxID=1927128 RepID=A0A291B718_9GAMM|nr:Mobile element protein [Candidatus Enterovibrio luxaltus]